MIYMEESFYKIMIDMIETEVSLRIREKFQVFRELIDEEECNAFLSEISSDKLKVFVVDKQNLYIISIGNESYMEIYHKSKIDKIDLKIDVNKIYLSVIANNTTYSMDTSEMNYWFTSRDLKRWIITFAKALK